MQGCFGGVGRNEVLAVCVFERAGWLVLLAGAFGWHTTADGEREARSPTDKVLWPTNNRSTVPSHVIALPDVITGCTVRYGAVGGWGLIKGKEN
jgi:hypothetical protein